MDIINNPKIKENNIDLNKILWILSRNYGFQHNSWDIHIDLGQTCFRCGYLKCRFGQGMGFRRSSSELAVQRLASG